MKKLSILFLFVLIFCSSSYSQQYKPTWESIDSRPVPTWFEDAKFGIFIHWGVYSVPAYTAFTENISQGFSEWYWSKLNENNEYGAALREFHKKNYGDNTYQEFAKDFKAELYNPNEWVEIFQNAGAKYVVLTSKHHDGYALWPSQHSWNWNSVDLQPHRDLCGELTNAVKKTNMRMGFYYSLYEWYNPLYHSDLEAYVDSHMIPQMKDLVTRYEPELIFSDGEWEHPSEKFKSTEFLAWLYNESPVKQTVVVNDRWGKETRSQHGGYYTTEYNHVGGDKSSDALSERPWEECRGIGNSFGFNRNEKLSNYSTSTELVHMLIDKVSRGGNFLLNVGPTADGRIPLLMQQTLKEIGDWLKINGEAIYSSRTWKKAEENKKENLSFTTKGKDLYLFVTKWTDEDIEINGISQADNVSLLGYNGKINFTHQNKKLKINTPTITIGNAPCEHAWVFKIIGGAQ